MLLKFKKLKNEFLKEILDVSLMTSWSCTTDAFNRPDPIL
jgi:hypothetical protein